MNPSQPLDLNQRWSGRSQKMKKRRYMDLVVVQKTKSKKETPPERVTHLVSISIDDGVGTRSDAGAGSRRHRRGRCCLTLETFYCKKIKP